MTCMTCQCIFSKNKIASDKGGASTAHSSGAHKSTPVFSEVRDAQSLVYYVVFYRSLFVLLSFFLCPLSSPTFFEFSSDYP